MTPRLAAPRDLAGLMALYRELRPGDPVLPDAEAGKALERILGDTS